MLSPTFLNTHKTSSSNPQLMPPMTSLRLIPCAIDVRTMNSLSRSLDLIRPKSRLSLYQSLNRPSADFIPSVNRSSFDLCSVEDFDSVVALVCAAAWRPATRMSPRQTATQKRNANLDIDRLQPVEKGHSAEIAQTAHFAAMACVSQFYRLCTLRAHSRV